METRDLSAAPTDSIIEGFVKFRDGKKWKSRWCALRKLSPVADYMHLQLYRDSKARQKGNLPKASLSLWNFIGCESGFTLDKESHTLALLCKDGPGAVIALAEPEELLRWKTRASRALSPKSCSRWPAFLSSPGVGSGLKPGPISVHVHPSLFCIVSGVPPKILAVWRLADLRRYGMVDGRICYEGGSRCGKMSGAWVLQMERASLFINTLNNAAPPPSNECEQKRFSEMSESTRNIFQFNKHVMKEWSLHGTLNDYASSVGDNSQMSRFITRSDRHTNILRSPWSTESVTEKRSESDRTSLYSQSSGTSEYSMPRGYLFKEAISCSRPASVCSCRSSQRHTGPYENYDVPRPAMPLIHENPDTEIIYDKPRNIRKCLVNNSMKCNCNPSMFSRSKSTSNSGVSTPHHCKNHSVPSNRIIRGVRSGTVSTQETNQMSTSVLETNNRIGNKDGHSNLEVIEQPTTKWCIDSLPDLSLYENCTDILRNAGFSQAEIDSVEEQSNVNYSTSTSPDFNTNNVAKESFICTNPNHQNVCELNNNNNLPLIVNVNGNFNRRKSSSADFLKRAEEFFGLTKTISHKEVSVDLNPLAKCGNYQCVNMNCSESKHKCDIEQINKAANNNQLVESIKKCRVQNTVKIRRSSSVPNKSLKNRDSSSSSDSGVSTGSIQQRQCHTNHCEVLLRNTKLYSRPNTTPSQSTANTNPLHIEKITFQFKNEPEVIETQSVQPYDKPSNNHCQHFCRDFLPSPLSCGSDLSDYLESISVSSISSSETSNRSTARPRSGREYASLFPMQLAKKANVCDCCAQFTAV